MKDRMNEKPIQMQFRHRNLFPIEGEVAIG